MDYTILSDEILVRLLRTGDEFAFKEIYLRYSRRLYDSAFYKLRCRESVEEIIQNLFLKLWQNREGAEIRKLEHYLFTSLKYNIINFVERKIVEERYFRQLKNEEGDAAAYFEETLGLKELRSVIEQSLSMLPDKTQTVFRLRKLEDYSIVEIANTLNISEKTVEYHISKSIKILRTQLKDYIIPIFFLLSASVCFGQAMEPLYPAAIPNSKHVVNEEYARPDPVVDTVVANVSNPGYFVFHAPEDKSNGTAVIICPGGGYGVLCINMEGKKIARAFNELGVTAIVLKYRLPSDRTMVDKSIGPLQDAQQAIKTIRMRATDLGIDTNKIGIMGFSAGGHLAATAGTQFGRQLIQNKEGTNLRPNFMILIYPVISFTDSIGHIGSRTNLLGAQPSPALIAQYSNELQVTPSTPPTFLTHAAEDSVVAVANSMAFFNKLSQNKVPAALHVYAKGRHGYLDELPPFKEWFAQCGYWLREMRLIP